MAKIEVKFNLGDEVFAFQTTTYGPYLYRGKVEGISIDEDGAEYLIDDSYEFYKEEDLLSVACSSDELYDKIYELTKKVENGPKLT